MAKQEGGGNLEGTRVCIYLKEYEAYFEGFVKEYHAATQSILVIFGKLFISMC